MKKKVLRQADNKKEEISDWGGENGGKM